MTQTDRPNTRRQILRYTCEIEFGATPINAFSWEKEHKRRKLKNTINIRRVKEFEKLSGAPRQTSCSLMFFLIPYIVQQMFLNCFHRLTCCLNITQYYWYYQIDNLYTLQLQDIYDM